MENKKRLINLDEAIDALGVEDKDICFKYFLEERPIVDAVPVVHGRWVQKGAWHIECSECQYILAHIGEAKNYCPNCGAKMDGGIDHE